MAKKQLGYPNGLYGEITKENAQNPTTWDPTKIGSSQSQKISLDRNEYERVGLDTQPTPTTRRLNHRPTTQGKNTSKGLKRAKKHGTYPEGGPFTKGQ